MKNIILRTIIIGLMALTTSSFAAICDCGAPPECGPSRPSHCPLVDDDDNSNSKICFYQETQNFGCEYQIISAQGRHLGCYNDFANTFTIVSETLFNAGLCIKIK